jgi:hypothetical protein
MPSAPHMLVAMSRDRTTRTPGVGPPARQREWVGGRVALPPEIAAGDGSPLEMILLHELPDDLIVTKWSSGLRATSAR